MDKAQAAKREYMREWRKNNREKLNEYQRQWRKSNKEKLREYSQRYWDKKANEMEIDADGR